MDENILNIWLEILYENLSNKKILFLKVNTGDTKNFSESLNIFIRKDISIINIDILKEKNGLEKIGTNLIIISDSLEPIENMKLILNREIIYIEDVNSINKLVELLNNKSLDYYNEIKYDFLQKVNFEKLINSNLDDIGKFVSDRLSLLEKINCNFGNIDSNFLEICLKNYNSKKLLVASFAQLLYRLANLDFISSAKKIGGKIRQIVGVASNPVNSNQLQGLNIRLSLRNYRIYDLNEKPFVMDTKIDIAQKLVKLNLKGLDVIKVAQITELPLKKVEKMYREAFIK
jgi:hypothetical protein